MKFLQKLTEKLRGINADGKAGVAYGCLGWTILAIIIVIYILILQGCCPCRHLSSSVSDSVSVETRTEYIERIDTQVVELPVEVYRNVTLDTISRLSGRYAQSTAIVADGVLRHDLIATGSVPVAVRTVDVVRDSIVYRDRVATEVVEVAAQPSRWDRFCRRSWWPMAVLVAAGAAAAAWRLYRRLRP